MTPKSARGRAALLPAALFAAAAAVAVVVPALGAPASAGSAPAASSGATPAVAAPTITTPPAGSHGFPFMTDAQEIAAKGYVEEEFLIGGTATAYKKAGTFGSDGHWQVTPGSQAPYQTRIVVRRPSNPAKFNGTVVVEWFNVTGQIDAPAEWVTTKEELLRSGYAYVGVSAQKAGIDGGNPGFPALKGWDPGRYGTLTHPGDQYSYDIFSQAGQALRTPNGPDPLGNLKPTKIIAAGESQSAFRLTTYVDAVAPVARVFDAHLIHSSFSAGAPLEDFPGDSSMPNPTRIRTDLSAPTFVVETESDVPMHLSARQPNSATVHTWEITGTSHADQWLLNGTSAAAARSFGMPTPARECGTGAAPINDGPQRYGVNAALAALNRWARGGPRPATAADITVTSEQIVRDPATGIATGGVRLPDITVPTRTLTGQRNATGAGALCFLFGAVDPWNGDGDAWDTHDADDPSDPGGTLTPEPDLSRRYPTHAGYVAKVRAAARSAVREGFLTPGDAATIVAAARSSTIGR
jgi:hypothetical protein